LNAHDILEFYNVDGEYQEDEDPINLQVPETEGERIVEGRDIEFVVYPNPLKMHKVNIGIEDNPKFTNVGDY
jgi:hypothetical protein